MWIGEDVSFCPVSIVVHIIVYWTLPSVDIRFDSDMIEILLNGEYFKTLSDETISNTAAPVTYLPHDLVCSTTAITAIKGVLHLNRNFVLHPLLPTSSFKTVSTGPTLQWKRTEQWLNT